MSAGDVWRYLHLIGASLWLGGLAALAVTVLSAARALEPPAFREFIRTTGWALVGLFGLAWGLLGVSGLVLAGPLLQSWPTLPEAGRGRLLLAKIVLSGLLLAGSAAHVVSGRRTGSRTARVVSRLLAVAIFAVSLVVFWLGVRLA